MTSDQEIKLAYELIEKNFGSGVLMRLEDIVRPTAQELKAYDLYCRYCHITKSTPFPFKKMREYIEFNFWKELV